MGDFPTADEQREAMAERQRQEAEQRVERREKLGQEARPEPALGDEAPETPDLPNVGSQLNEATNDEN